jgi:hypothetical protein
MADMDTYADEPRQYEGNSYYHTSNSYNGYQQHREPRRYFQGITLADIHRCSGRRGANLHADERDYAPPRDRSRSPVGDRDGDIRDREPANGRDDRYGYPRSAYPEVMKSIELTRPSGPPPNKNGGDDDATNPGSNLFVTGIHPRLTEDEITRLFEKYGQVEKCNIMRDPHTRESRGFGFVKMMTAEEADAAKDGLQGEQYEGRTLSIEKARRARPRTPTPGKYFGPPKRGQSTRPYGQSRDCMLTSFNR